MLLVFENIRCNLVLKKGIKCYFYIQLSTEISEKGLLHFNKHHSCWVTELITGQASLSARLLGVHFHCGKWQNA